MELTPEVCTDKNGYNTFVLPEFQYACDSSDYNNAKEDPKIKKILESKNIDELPCCNVNTTDHDPKDKGSDYVLEEARKSFMSGHSSFSFYCATFLVIYLQVRLSNEQVKDSELLKDGNAVARMIFRYFQA